MTELEFARAYLDDYRQRGDEIVAKLCPFCHGGQHGDKYTFSINTEKHVYKCQRGSCGAEGHFNQLLTKYGLPMEPSLLPQDTRPRAVHTPKVARHYVRPAPCNVVAQGTEMDYIRSRGITPETAAAFGVGGNGKGEVVFPYYDNRTEYECRKPTSSNIDRHTRWRRENARHGARRTPSPSCSGCICARQSKGCCTCLKVSSTAWSPGRYTAATVSLYRADARISPGLRHARTSSASMTRSLLSGTTMRLGRK